MISTRHHDLVLAMILDRPVMALSDHAKQVSLDPPFRYLFVGRKVEEVLLVGESLEYACLQRAVFLIKPLWVESMRAKMSC